MKSHTKVDSDEINLVELMQIIWKGKWKIVAVIVISIASAFIFVSSKSDNFKATTAIEPINISEETRYMSLYNISKMLENRREISPFVQKTNDTNDTNFSMLPEKKDTFSLQNFIVSRDSLLMFYVQILREKSLFEDAIHKYNLLDVSKYSDEKEYNEAITKLASKIKIITTTIPSEDENVASQSLIDIEFLYYDSEKWKNVLKYVHENANKVVKQKLKNHLESLLIIKKNEQNNKLEDLKIIIENLIADYDRVTSDQILYLIEQSEIAKKLGISKNTIEVQTFGSQTLFSSVNTDVDSPFYLRGYEAIDKEISLMTSRINKKAFIKGLYAAEQEVRAIKQDKYLERILSSIASSPLAENQEFSAGTIKFLITKFEYNSLKKTLFFALVIGSIIGLFVVFISNSLQNHKIVRNN
tara:strand:+ start:78 stop:1319 length:1242 start_codon:yes stop_codon:yes gene_type:complete